MTPKPVLLRYLTKNRLSECHSGPEQEDIYLELLHTAFMALSKNPNLGRVYAEVYPGLRGYLAGRHIILYQVSDVAVEIVRVLHHSMDLDSQL
ncbi:MAG: type II toxin-antitoxin system RelE/ParE family toxin [Verrucomicrobia bacterium]|nr:type II toxin-antitoxin system RelE/ParE family toxin [Verrucomicrobiota bacterium]